jgi:hypothetical protein
MPIILYLTDYKFADNQSDWHDALNFAFPASFASGDTQDRNEPPHEHPAYAKKDAILFCHSNGCEPQWRQKSNDADCHIVIVRGGGRWKEEQNAKGNLHGCYWSPDELQEAAKHPASNFRLAHWIEQIRAGEPTAIEWKLLRSAATERLWALRILCEAFEVPETRTRAEQANWIDLLKNDSAEERDAVVAAIKRDVAALNHFDDAAVIKPIDTLLDSIESGGSPRNPESVQACLNTLNSLLGITTAE